MAADSKPKRLAGLRAAVWTAGLFVFSWAGGRVLDWVADEYGIAAAASAAESVRASIPFLLTIALTVGLLWLWSARASVISLIAQNWRALLRPWSTPRGYHPTPPDPRIVTSRIEIDEATRRWRDEIVKSGRAIAGGAYQPPQTSTTVLMPSSTQLALLPEHEKTLRLKALDELYHVIVPVGKVAYAETLAIIQNHRALLLEFEDGKSEILASVFKLQETYRNMKGEIAAIRRKHELHVDVFPKVALSFPEATRFFDGAGKFNEALNALQPPITLGHITLLKPWIYAYQKDMAQFSGWLESCAKAIKDARDDLLKA